MRSRPDDGWTALAGWYDRKQGETGDLWHRALIDPGLEAVIGKVDGLRLLDLGCGNGYLARRFAKRGATVVGVDVTRGMIARALRRGNVRGRVTYVLGDAARMPTLPTASFDLAFANMSLMDMPNADEVLAEAGRLVRPGGRLVASLCHPCFDTDSNSGWLTEHIRGGGRTGRVVWKYRTPTRTEAPWILPDGSVRRTGSYNRTLSWYANTIRSAGFVIERMEEPAPQPELLMNGGNARWIAEIPLHLVIGARRVDDDPARPAGATGPTGKPVKRRPTPAARRRRR